MAEFTLPVVDNRSVVLLGGGVLGRRIAAVWVAGGFDVVIRDPSADQRTAAKQFVDEHLSEFNPAQQTRVGSLSVTESLKEAVSKAWLVIECVPEKQALKESTFAELESVAPKDALLATNSSSYKSRELVGKIKPETRKRVCNMHYMMPPGNKLVELMSCGSTEATVLTFLKEKLEQVGMHPIIARKECSGFVVNRLWAAIKREVLTILAEGVSVPKELDSAWLEMFTVHPNGPCIMMDQVGLDTVSLIEQHYVKERGLSPKMTVDFLQSYLDQGKLGAKSSKGGLYPPPSHAKSRHDEEHLPTLYFLDIGLAQPNLTDVFSKGSILALEADGTTARTLVENQHFPDGIQISKKHGKLYWTAMGIPTKNDGSIWSSNLDGSDAKMIVPTGKTHTPKQTYLDEVNEKLYFSDREGLRVFRCNLDGSALEVIVQTGDWEKPEEKSDQRRWCVGIAVSPGTGKFYWTQKGTSKGSIGRIFRANIDFTDGQNATNRKDIECLFQNLPEPIDLEVDEKNNLLYWTDRGELPLGNSVNRVSLDKLSAKSEKDGTSMPGKDYELIVRNLHEAIGLALDERHGHLYTTDLGGAVNRFDLDGKNKKKVYEGGGAYAGITLAQI